jgi:polyisoprenoid-binding protein YceI
MSVRRQPLPLDLGLPVGLWRVDREQSEVKVVGTTKRGLLITHGKLPDFDGYLQVTDDEAQLELVVLAASVDAGHPRRTTRLMSLLKADTHPTISFRSDTITAGAGDNVQVAGQMQGAGASGELTFRSFIKREPLGRLRLNAAVTVRTVVGRRSGISVRSETTLIFYLALDPSRETQPPGALTRLLVMPAVR